MKRIRLIQISNGVGSGNIGDELMAQEFWKLLPGNVVLDVPVLAEASRFRGSYPAPHRYYPVGSRMTEMPNAPGLLVGDTPVAEFEGLGYPLQTVGPAISAILRRGLPVDAISVGVDRLHTPEARQLFASHYSAIRSWTVRSEACREALLDLGVPPERIRVAADLAWLFCPGAETDAWAAELWNRLGMQTERPLLVVNVVHHADPVDIGPKRVLAEALDRLARDGGYQIAFLNNESRQGPLYDTAAAADVRAFMQEPSVEVPPAFYTPQEMVSLLRPAATVLSQRYHMAIQAILAGTIPVCLMRGQKLSGLAREFDLLAAELEAGPIVERVTESAARRQDRIAALAGKREEHRVRAGEALSFFREYLAQGTPAPRRRAAVRQVVVIHLGGLGDLVLASSLFAALRRKYGKASILLLCRAPFAKFPALFPSPPDQVAPIRLDPSAHSQPGPKVAEALRELNEQLGELRPDIVLSAELEPSWLSWYLASRWQAPVNLACTRMEAPQGLLPTLLREALLDPVEFDGPAWHSEMIEGDRYAQLAKAVGIEDCPAPRWTINPEQDRQTTSFLEANGMGVGDYAVCFPLGAASTLVKRWPAESFASALEQATQGFAMPVILTGEAHEKEALESHAAELRSRGATAAVFAGTTDELSVLGGLLAQAKFFLGNDTGPAHLAQAYGTPGAVVFGGGTWPHYRPWGTGAVGVVHPLPCFGCRWDCVFGRPLCIEGVTVEAVVRALEQAKANPNGPADVIELASAVADSVVQLATIWRTAAEERLTKLEELSRTHELVTSAAANRADGLDELDRPFQGAEPSWAQLQVAADSRLKLIETISKELADLRDENADRLSAIKRADSLLHRQDDEIRELRAGYAVRLVAIKEANTLLEKQEHDIQELREGNAARLSALERADSLLHRQDDEIRELRAGYAVRLVAIKEANTLLQKQEHEIQELREGNAARLSAIESADSLLHRQDDEIRELRAGYAARLVAIEEANVLLRAQQEDIARLRGETAVLQSERAWQIARVQELDLAATERLAALQHANLLLGAAIADNVEQGNRLRMFEQAAAERLVALEATTAHLHAETFRRAHLAADLDSVAAAQSEARRRQAEEREGWQKMLAELNQERTARLAAEEKFALLRSDLERITAERDRYRRSTEELALSEQDLRGQILAAESETLLQSVFRRTIRKNH